MKSRRFLSVFLCAVLALTLLTPAALANSWGLKSGMILNVVSKTHDYDEYTALAQVKLPGGEVAVMASRYHAVLLYAYRDENGKLQLDAYHTAVKQPDERGFKLVKLTRNDYSFILEYEDLSLEFRPYGLNGFSLDSGRIGELTLQAGSPNTEQIIWLTCSDGKNSYNWQAGEAATPLLSEFNLRLFPRTLDEIGASCELEYVLRAQFESVKLSAGKEMPGDAGAATVPVYSAPSEGSVRFAKGKASVNLREPAKLYGLTRDGNWALIEYAVSDRTSRFGYVKRSDLPGSAAWTFTLPSVDVPVTVTQDTFLTDDPNVSQYRQMTLNAGSSVRLLGLYDLWYAYVEATLDGKTVRGFVPRAYLHYPLPTEEAPEAVARLLGEWECIGGGETLKSDVAFRADGNVAQTWLPLAEMETASEEDIAEYGPLEWQPYQVYKSTERERASFWYPCDYVLVFRNSIGYIDDFYALDFDTDENGRDTFSVLYGEGGSGYVRRQAANQ